MSMSITLPDQLYAQVRALDFLVRGLLTSEAIAEAEASEDDPLEVDLIRKGRFVVAVPHGAGPILTSREVEDTRDAVLREHESGW